MKIEILPEPVAVSFEGMVAAIERYNQAGRNPFGPNVPVRSHSPLLFVMEWPGCLDVQFPFYACDRDQRAVEFLAANPLFHTRHALVFPMTRALIARQWHRAYAFDVRRQDVTNCKLLVSRKHAPELFDKYPFAGAWPWVVAAKESAEPVSLD